MEVNTSPWDGFPRNGEITALVRESGKNRMRLSTLLGLSLLCFAAGANATDGQPLTASAAGQNAAHHGKPTELQLQRAGSRKFDLRKLPHTKPKQQERPEFEEPEPNPTELPSGLTAPAASISAPGPSAPAPAPNAVYEGLDRFTWGAGSPPDTNGDVGPTYYIQTVNTSIGVYSKADGSQQAAFTFNTFMSQGNFGNLCDTDNFGDPVVLYDTFEDRWIITDFAFKLDGGGNVLAPAYQCFAASMSGDPISGGWNFYSRLISDNLDDYPKFGIWPDGLYMSANMFSFGAGSSFQGARAWAFNKAQMYAGSATVQVVQFDVGGGDFTVIPSNARLQTGTPAPGTPNYFVSTWQFLNALTVYKFHVDWNSISLSTFTGPDTPLAATSWPNAAVANAPQPGTANLIDVLQIRAMVQNQYTNLGGAESLWLPHTVRRANTSGFAASRWYQVDVTGGTVAANLPQAATWDPDGANVSHRFTPSLALDRTGNMAMGYSISNSTTMFPSMAYAGRLAGDPVNTFSQTEQTFFSGTASQTGSTRWGDYSSMTLDPDGCTFWYTNEYANPADQTFNHRWLTKFGSFGPFPGCTPVGAGGTVSGTVTVSPGGAPISGATVALGARSTTTDGSGFYSFTSIPAGTYPTLSASMPGFGSASASSIVVTDSGTTTQNFSLSSAATSSCLTDTTQADFLLGVPTSLDLTTSPGDVTLSNAPLIDQQNTTLGSSGVGITITTYGGQTFTPSVTGLLQQVDINLFCSGCTGTTPNLTLSVRATAGGLPTGADLTTATITGFSDGGVASYHTATFASPVTLTAGTQYALVIHPTVNPLPGTYALTRSGTSVAGSDVYAGGTRVTGATSGTVWSIPLTGGVSTDAGFKTHMNVGYRPSGDLVSSTKDANPAANYTPHWTTLSWNASTPANTGLSFQVAASNSVGGPFNFVGPDGTAATFFTTSGASLSQFNGSRYLQYRSYLTSSDGLATPTMNDVTTCFADNPPADLSITKDDGVSSVAPGAPVVYTITAENPGPGDATGATVADAFPAGLTCSSWTCSSNGGTCTASGAGDINDTVDLPAGTDITYSASCTLDVGATIGSTFSNTATLTAAANDVFDPDTGNNSATDQDTVAKNPTTTSLTSSQNPSVFGQSVTFTATVSRTLVAGTPTGGVTFKDGGTPLGGAVTLSGGVATLSTSALAAGNHTITAEYGGDVDDDLSSAALTGNPQVVAKDSTTTAVTSSVNPSAAGQRVTFTATVSPVSPGSGTPTGTVTFSSGATVLASPIALNGSAQAVFATPVLTEGNHTITAHYNGDGNFAVSTGSLPGGQTVIGTPNLSLSVDDSHLFARYGMVLDYLVTLANSGTGTATNVSVSSTASAGLDVANTNWTCSGAGSGATCTASGVGAFADTATLPPNRSLNWLVSVPVFNNTTDDTVSLTISAAGASDATDIDTLVIFRDTFEVQNGDGTQAIPSPENVGVLSGSVNQLFTLPASRGNAIGDVVTLSSGSAQVRVQSVTLGKTTLVRVLTEANGQEHASAWANAQVGATLSVGSVSADGKRVILLEGAEKPLAAPLAQSVK